MQNHQIIGNSQSVFHINTFQRAIGVANGRWSGASQVVSWAQGSPFLGVAGKLETDHAGENRVYLIGPVMDQLGSYVRVVRVSASDVTDNPKPSDEAVMFCRLLDGYQRSNFSEEAWFRANAGLELWATEALRSVVNEPELYRRAQPTQNWLRLEDEDETPAGQFKNIFVA